MRSTRVRSATRPSSSHGWRTVVSGTLLAVIVGIVVSPEISKLIANDPPVRELTERQRSILMSMAGGKGNKEIAAELGIRADSVRQHVIAILSKLGATNRAEAVAIALRKHLLKT